MNVTVHIPASLGAAFEGRRTLQLGVPKGAELADVLQTLFTLYPRVYFLLPHEGPGARVQLSLFTEPQVARTLRLREGQPLVLVGTQPSRLVDA